MGLSLICHVGHRKRRKETSGVGDTGLIQKRGPGSRGVICVISYRGCFCGLREGLREWRGVAGGLVLRLMFAFDGY